MPVLGPVFRQCQRKVTPTQAASGHRAYARFSRNQRVDSEHQWDHELQNFATRTEVDVEANSHAGSDGIHGIRKTVQFDVTYDNSV